MKMSRAMVDAAALALKAAQARDVTALMDASDRIVLVCETCHEPYRDQGRKMPIK
jgi:cytochrome c556